MSHDSKYDMGGIYVLSSPDGYYKIGCCAGPIHDRVNQFAPKLPFETEVYFAFICVLGKERQVESLLHKRFASKRVRGEWFKLDEQDLQWFMQNPLPLPIACSHSACWAQGCLEGHTQEHLMEELLGLS